ncbi:unnamed protein product [Agarophyton chilense]
MAFVSPGLNMSVWHSSLVHLTQNPKNCRKKLQPALKICSKGRQCKARPIICAYDSSQGKVQNSISPPSDQSHKNEIASVITSFRESYTDRIPIWLINRLEEMGFTYPTSVQQSTLPLALPSLKGELGKDIVIHAQTGSGKTLAYLLPLITAVQPARSVPQAMVVVPTQELGMQVYKLLRRLTSACIIDSDASTAVDGNGNADGDFGGIEKENTQGDRFRFPVLPMLNQADLRRQKLQLREAAPRVIVGNPHRIAELVRSRRLRLDLLKVLVVDEFDACLNDTSTTSALQAILSVRGREGPRQTILASATVPQHRHFLRQCVSQRWTRSDIVHVWTEQETKERVPESLTHLYAVCESRKKLAALRTLLVRFNSDTRTRDSSAFVLRAIVFVMASRNVKLLVEALNNVLRQDFDTDNDPVVGIWDDSSVFCRKNALLSFRQGTAKVLIGTDVAARGLDVPDITHVFHFDLPTDADAYLHRAGRAGRQGRPGSSVVLVAPGEQFVVSRISNSLGIEFLRLGK